jgi:hypothetical protein
MLNALTEHDFQAAFKKNARSAENGAWVRKGMVMVTIVPKLDLTSPENYG